MYIELPGYNGLLYTFQNLLRKDQSHCCKGYIKALGEPSPELNLCSATDWETTVLQTLLGPGLLRPPPTGHFISKST